jgi:hypothetical protein
MDDAFDIVQVIAKHRYPGVTARRNQLHEFLDRGIDIQRDNMCSRRHHFPGDLVAELHDGLNHFSRVVFENSFFLPRIDESLDLFL